MKAMIIEPTKLGNYNGIKNGIARKRLSWALASERLLFLEVGCNTRMP